MSTIKSLIIEYENHQKEVINLVASENLMSSSARYALQSDLAHRYSMPPEDERSQDLWEYPNQKILRVIESRLKELMKEIYHGDYADARPLSGNNVAAVVFKSLVPNGATIFSVSPECGGHFTTKKLCGDQKIKQIFLPYNKEKGIVDLDQLNKLVNLHNPHLVFLDASMILFPYPLKEMRQILGDEVIISYDASHTFGLIGGGQFQSPLLEGADIIHGSTHKSLFGPQKGMIICKRNDELARKINNIITPFFVSNSHPHHSAALAIALEEIKAYGAEYAAQVIKNAQYFGKCLYNTGLDVLFPYESYTKSHQIIVSCGEKNNARKAFLKLEKMGIHVNEIKVPFRDSYGLRLGFNEVTRRGFKEKEIHLLSQIIGNCLRDKNTEKDLRDQVIKLSKQFTTISYDKDSLVSGKYFDIVS